MDRETAIKQFGIEIINELDRKNCHPTGRINMNHFEMASFIKIDEDKLLKAVYLITEDEFRNTEDLADLQMDIAYYEVI